ncbi:hypothetical protein [Kineococcus sp. NUM-3379]
MTPTATTGHAVDSAQQEPAAARSCCSPQEAGGCCEPSAKASCCGGSATPGATATPVALSPTCGCR